jgi:FkbH-like protein
VTLFDLDEIAAAYGKRRWVDARYWHHSKHAFAFDASGLLAHEAAAMLAAAKGLAKKCLVLDLDNTLWGGVIGDDGIEGIQLGSGTDGEAFAAFQGHIKALKDRGVILAVCSKNEEANAMAPFRDHPDMRLSLDDIAVFRANWDNKADNIRAIAETLNIGLDSMVFLDDNPVERGLVRRYLPMVTVPELPSDPAGYLDVLAAGRWFETLSFGAEDRQRADYYRDNAQRAGLQSQFRDHTDYLTSLEMAAEYGDLDSFRLPRMAQLIGKSNQFHLTGTRHGEAELRRRADGIAGQARWYALRDRFGDNGLISVVVFAWSDGVLDLDTWVMSCRVLARGMEEFILNDLVDQSLQRGCTAITARYVPSAKNGLVAGLYPRLGFTETAAEPGGTRCFRLDLAEWSPRDTAIRSEA